MGSSEQDKKTNNVSVNNQDSSHKRFLILTYLILTNFCLSIMYDMPGSLETQIEHTFSIESYKFELLYSIYSFPYVFLGMISGILVDRILGVKNASFIFIAFCLLGQIIMSIGAFVKIFWLMLVGRFFYGVGGESMQIILMYYSVLWFANNEINFVFGLVPSIGRMGTSLMFLVAFPLYKYALVHGANGLELGVSTSLGIGLSVVVLLSTLLITWESLRCGKLQQTPKMATEEISVLYKVVATFPFKYWLIVAMACANTTAVFVYVSCSQKLLSSKFNLSAEAANHFGSLFNIMGAVVSPFPGALVDKIGYDMYAIIVGFLLGTISQIILAFTFWNPYGPIILFSISFATLSACTLPMIPFIVESNQVGTAYGIYLSILNLCFSTCMLLVGFLLDKYGYIAPVIFYLSLLLAGLICSIILLIIDRNEDGMLNLPGSAKKLRLKQRE